MGHVCVATHAHACHQCYMCTSPRSLQACLKSGGYLVLIITASALIALAGIVGWPPPFSHRQSKNLGNGFIAMHLQRPCLITAVLFGVQVQE